MPFSLANPFKARLRGMPRASLHVQRRSEHSELLFSKGCANAKRVQEAIVRQVLPVCTAPRLCAPIPVRTARLRRTEKRIRRYK